MTTTGAASTPLPRRGQLNPTRRAYEEELWDDLANVVYYGDDAGTTLAANTTYTTGSIIVPAPVASRFELWGQVWLYWSGGFQNARYVILVDGVEVGAQGVLGAYAPGADSVGGTVAYTEVYDVAPGDHTVQMKVFAGPFGPNVGAERFAWHVRRGRKPVG